MEKALDPVMKCQHKIFKMLKFVVSFRSAGLPISRFKLWTGIARKWAEIPASKLQDRASLFTSCFITSTATLCRTIERKKRTVDVSFLWADQACTFRGSSQRNLKQAAPNAGPIKFTSWPTPIRKLLVTDLHHCPQWGLLVSRRTI